MDSISHLNSDKQIGDCMLNRPGYLIFLCLSLVPYPAQQTASLDLTVSDPAPAPVRISHLPAGCNDLQIGAYADGIVAPEGGKPFNISVKATNLSKNTLAEGGKLRLRVELHNRSERPIKIPWSTDPEIIYADQSPTSYQWESGRFIVYVRNEDGEVTPLKSLSKRLYGNDHHLETLLTVNSGEWVSAIIEEKIESDYPYYEKGLAGNWQLSVDWEQLKRSNGIRNCYVTIGTWTYSSFYEQSNPGIPIAFVPAPGTEQE